MILDTKNPINLMNTAQGFIGAQNIPISKNENSKID